MLWVGLATLIMLITGTGDDTVEFRKRQQAMQKALQEVVVDAQRRASAEQALQKTTVAFRAHRDRLHEVGSCIDEVDKNYHATRADYDACLERLEWIWDTAASEFLTAEQGFRAALEPEELTALHQRVLPQ